MREASAQHEKALSPAAPISLSTHALCQKNSGYSAGCKWRSGGKIGWKNKRWSDEKGVKLVLLVTETFEKRASL